MKSFAVTLLVLGGASALASDTAVNGDRTMTKVVKILQDMLEKSQKEGAVERDLYAKFKCYCDDNEANKKEEIKEFTKMIQELENEIDEVQADTGKLSTMCAEYKQGMADNEEFRKNAQSVRDKENEAFKSEETDMVDGIGAMDQAIETLSEVGADQTAAASLSQQKTTLLKASVKEALAAVRVLLNNKQKKTVGAFLQAPFTGTYTAQSGEIVGILKNMRDTFKENLATIRAGEKKAAEAHEKIMKTKEEEFETMKTGYEEGQSKLGDNDDQLADLREQLDEAKGELAAAEDFLAKLKESCSSKAAEWAARQKSASEELGAIAKAQEILEDGVKEFLQVSSKTGSTDEDEKRQQVADIVRKLASKNHGFALSQIAAAATSDPFGKVRGLIESMIDRLTKEAAEEADAKSFCDSETSKSKKKQADLTADSDRHAARIEKATANKAQLLEQIKGLEASIAEMDSSQSKATSLRQQEHEEYLQASSDYKQSAEAVANAISVLNDYYSKGSFLQVASKVGQAPEFNSAKTDVAGTIMEMLEVAESDFTKLLAEAEAEESSAQDAYDKLTQENKVARAAATTDAKGKGAEVKQLETSLLNYKEDHATTSKELDAVLAYLDKLKPQCETKVMTYAERKAKREEEIEGLKQALEILSA